MDFTQILTDKDAELLLGKRIRPSESNKREIASSSEDEEEGVAINTKRQKTSKDKKVSSS